MTKRSRHSTDIQTTRHATNDGRSFGLTNFERQLVKFWFEYNF